MKLTYLCIGFLSALQAIGSVGCAVSQVAGFQRWREQVLINQLAMYPKGARIQRRELVEASFKECESLKLPKEFCGWDPFEDRQSE